VFSVIPRTEEEPRDQLLRVDAEDRAVLQSHTMDISHIDVIHPHVQDGAQYGSQHAADDAEGLADEPPLLIELTSQRLQLSRHTIQLVGDVVHRTMDQNITHDNGVDMKSHLSYIQQTHIIPLELSTVFYQPK
jgi:hypothetical protein